MIIIDFEASSLRKNSYPIEVAWGESPRNITSYLLNPDYMDGWTDWNPKSVEYHGLTLDELRKHGVDPRQAAAIMVRDLSGKPVYSDEVRYDTRWKNRLLADSGLDPSLVRIKDLNLYLNHLLRSKEPCKTVSDYACTFTCSETRRHRAAADVFWLLEFVEHIQKTCENP